MSSNLNTSKWQEYQVGDLFPDIVKPPVLHTREVMECEDGTPYVVRSKFNNGIKYRVRWNGSVEASPGGVITFGAENTTFFYQREPFVSGRDIYYIDTRSIPESACLFLVACLQTIAGRYAYNNGLFPALLREETIKLPTTDEGTPDWQWMDTFMAGELEQADKRIDFLHGMKANRHVVDSRDWMPFPIGGPGGLFAIEKGARLTRADMREGTTPFIGASTANNGVTSYVGNDEHIHPGNVITVAYNGQKATGKAFYQPEPFWASDDVHVLYPNFELNELRALFLLPIFRVVGEPYAFENKWKIEFMEKDCLPLPVNDDGTPDWEYMECKMRKAIAAAKASVDALGSL